MKDSLRKDVVKNFHQDKQPVLIYGKPGSGKSFIARELLKETIKTIIDTSHIKDHKYLKDYIRNMLNKKNITLMFNESNEQRGLIIDDLHVFYKHDKLSYKSIVELIKEGKFWGAKIVLTCCATFMKNKDLVKLKLNSFSSAISYSQYYRICIDIANQKEIHLSGDQYDKIIHLSKFNYNSFISDCYQEVNQRKDNFGTIEDITAMMFDRSLKCEEIYTLCSNDELVLSLNLLENILSFVEGLSDESLLKIYEYYSYSDIISYANIKYNGIFSVNSFSLSAAMINHQIHAKDMKVNQVTKIVYNKYISKSMVIVSSRNNFLSSNFTYHSLIIYLFNTYDCFRSPRVRDLILEMSRKWPKEIRHASKKYEYHYSSHINLKLH